MPGCPLVWACCNRGPGEPHDCRKRHPCPLMAEYNRSPGQLPLTQIGASGHLEDAAARNLTRRAHPDEGDCPRPPRLGTHQPPLNIMSFWPTPHLSDSHDFPHHPDPSSRFWKPSAAHWASCLPPGLLRPPLPPQSSTPAAAPPRGVSSSLAQDSLGKWNFRLMAANVEAFTSVH